MAYEQFDEDGNNLYQWYESEGGNMAFGIPGQQPVAEYLPETNELYSYRSEVPAEAKERYPDAKIRDVQTDPAFAYSSPQNNPSEFSDFTLHFLLPALGGAFAGYMTGAAAGVEAGAASAAGAAEYGATAADAVLGSQLATQAPETVAAALANATGSTISPASMQILQGSSDPIEALINLSEIGGGGTADAGAQALGFANADTAISNTFPQWASIPSVQVNQTVQNPAPTEAPKLGPTEPAASATPVPATGASAPVTGVPAEYGATTADAAWGAQLATQAPATVAAATAAPAAASGFSQMVKKYLGPLGKFFEENKTLANLAGGLGSGLLGVAGGIGKGLLDQSTVEKKIAADKELLGEKTRQEEELLKFKRGLIQSGDYFSSKLPFSAPAEKRPLRRLDGSPVYQGGLIASQRR